jgi:putative transposase
MSNYRRANTKGGTYFFTVVTYRRQRFLCNETVRTALREGIQATQATHPFTIDGWVLLPDHLHCIWTLPVDDADFGIRWAMIKRYVTKQCNPELKRDDWMKRSKQKRKESTIWQRRFWEHQIRDDRDYENHMDYLHYNPVKHGLVAKVANWQYSTFHRYVRQGVYGMDWAGVNVQDTENFGEPSD